MSEVGHYFTRITEREAFVQLQAVGADRHAAPLQNTLTQRLAI
jgi:hypothetical protein